MQINMALRTDWNDIKAMFIRISVVVMIFCCHFPAFALQGRRGWHSSHPHFMMKSVSGDTLMWIDKVLFNLCTSVDLPASSGVAISAFRESPMLRVPICFSMCFIACLATVFVFAWRCVVCGKLRQWLDNLAFVASLCYDRFRHGFLLVRKLCLGPIKGHEPLVGSSHYSSLLLSVKGSF